MDGTPSPSPKRAKTELADSILQIEVQNPNLLRQALPSPLPHPISNDVNHIENRAVTIGLSPRSDSNNVKIENENAPEQTLASEIPQVVQILPDADSKSGPQLIGPIKTTSNGIPVDETAPIEIIDEQEEVSVADSTSKAAPDVQLVPPLPAFEHIHALQNYSASGSVPGASSGQTAQKYVEVESGTKSPYASPVPGPVPVTLGAGASYVPPTSFAQTNAPPKAEVALKPEAFPMKTEASVKTEAPKLEPKEPKSRLVVLAGKCLQHHILDHLRSLRLVPNVPTIEVSADRLSTFPFKEYSYINFCIEYDETFIESLDKIKLFCETERSIFAKVEEIAYHFIFEKGKKWSDYTEAEKVLYTGFLECLSRIAGDKVTQCSLVNKYDVSTVYITEKDDLAQLGQEIQADYALWKNLKVFDYGDNCIRFLPGVKFTDSVQVINIGGGSSLETLAGFKMPAQLKVLVACKGLIPSIDYVTFPQTLERLDLLENRIFFLNYIDFPARLKVLDLSRNRIDSLKNVVFPRGLEFLSVSHNPIECIKGARFPESIEYLDLSCIPNESMTGIKFPDATVCLNLQQSMTNTRGLKLPPFVKELNLAGDGVNSINPLRLPNLIEKLFLANNNIKTLNKVAFPSALRELYLGNNLVTTLKNVQFPACLEVLDIEMDPQNEENEKYVTSLKDVVFPPNLRVLKLGYHLIKAIESMEFPFHLQELSLAYNDLRVFRSVRFGPKLRVLDLSGNQELMSVDSVVFPESLVEFKIPSLLLNNLPASVVERANKHELTLTKSLPFTV